MMLALYIVSLAASSAVLGLFGRDLLAEYGFIAGFRTGVLIAIGIGFAYAATQCLYMALLRFLEPTTSRVPYFTEILSHMSVAALLPYLADAKVAWPHEAMNRVEPLIYLAAFGALHLLFKLASYFASLQGELGARWSPLGWLGAAAACTLAAYAGMARWMDATDAAIPAAQDERQFYRVGDQYAEGRRIAEGAVYSWDASNVPGESLTVRWALPGGDDSGVEIDTVYTTVELFGDERKDFHVAAPVSLDGWTALHIPASVFPANVHSGTIRWAREETPSLQRLLGISPVVYGEARAQGAAAVRPAMIMSGPFIHQTRPDATQLNFLIILIDGLSADRMSFYGYGERTTPMLDSLAAQSTTFMNAFTPGLETPAVYETILTGVVPLRRQVTDESASSRPHPTLPGLLQGKYYATSAFLELHDDDLAPGRGLERGFEVIHALDHPAGADPLATSTALVEHARAFIDEHLEQTFFTVVRLRGLMNIMEAAEDPSGATYDAAVSAVDALVGEFIGYVRDQQTRRTTCVIVTAPHGYEPGAANPTRLSDPVLHVPLIMHVPAFGKSSRTDTMSLEDLTPSLALIGEVTLPRTIDGRHILSGANGNRPISAAGDPPTLSVRTEEWRYTWPSIGAEPAGPVGLFRKSPRVSEWWTNDLTTRDRQRAQRYREELESYLTRQRSRALQ